MCRHISLTEAYHKKNPNRNERYDNAPDAVRLLLASGKLIALHRNTMTVMNLFDPCPRNTATESVSFRRRSLSTIFIYLCHIQSFTDEKRNLYRSPISYNISRTYSLVKLKLLCYNTTVVKLISSGKSGKHLMFQGFPLSYIESRKRNRNENYT